jgi:predicted NAD-dependent protein-ADP-ribosyltransferase YbiA (DUF1768 family)
MEHRNLVGRIKDARALDNLLFEHAVARAFAVGRAPYRRGRCVTFNKTRDAFGALSNMAPGFRLFVNGLEAATPEALYQALRFPRSPTAQRAILQHTNPMAAKMESKRYRARFNRDDWLEPRVRVRAMLFCLRVKLAQYPQTFGGLLLDTGTRAIVEDIGARPATADALFWGAREVASDHLCGTNMMGILLTVLRDQLRAAGFAPFQTVAPPAFALPLLNRRRLRAIFT